uniref:Uncharacterized protein n=2 Tax=Palpitomonas bilix TaxID=652834 RepID=A0A7S3D309_9EUKA
MEKRQNSKGEAEVGEQKKVEEVGGHEGEKTEREGKLGNGIDEGTAVSANKKEGGGEQMHAEKEEAEREEKEEEKGTDEGENDARPSPIQPRPPPTPPSLHFVHPHSTQGRVSPSHSPSSPSPPSLTSLSAPSPTSSEPASPLLPTPPSGSPAHNPLRKVRSKKGSMKEKFAAEVKAREGQGGEDEKGRREELDESEGLKEGAAAENRGEGSGECVREKSKDEKEIEEGEDAGAEALRRNYLSM